MKPQVIIPIVAVIVLAGGGFLFYSMSKSASTPESVTPPPAVNEMQTPVASALPQENENESTDSSSSSQSGEVKEFTVESRGLNFTPNQISVKKGDTVRITYKNNMGRHDWVLDEFNAKTKLLNAGEEETIGFVADKAGSFEYYCSVPGHRQSGMKGTLVVE